MIVNLSINQVVIVILHKSWGLSPVFISLPGSHYKPASVRPYVGLFFVAHSRLLLALLSVREVHIRKIGRNRLINKMCLVY